MRVWILLAVVLFLSVYAWKDWYKSLCGLIVLMAVLQHPDMPRMMFDIPGLNPWNILFFTIVIAWRFQRRREEPPSDMPGYIVTLLLLNLGVLVIAFSRLVADLHSLPRDLSTAGAMNDYLFNPVKWAVGGLMLFDGARTRLRFRLGLAAIVTLYFLLSLQVMKTVSPTVLSDGAALSAYTVRRLNLELGYHRNDLSVMLAGASWAILSIHALVSSAKVKAGMLAAALGVLYAQALTGGRGGYLAWCVVGLTFGLLRWRWCLAAAPLIVFITIAFIPAVGERASMGIQRDSQTGQEDIDVDEFTAGRTIIWPAVIDKIWEAPFTGYGAAAMERTGLTALWADLEDAEEVNVQHPHNAYLEMLLIGGVVGFSVVLAFWGCILATAISLVRDRRSPVFVAAGGSALALVLAQLAGSFSGQSFYPREATFGLWCATGLMLRVSVQRALLDRQASVPVPRAVTPFAQSSFQYDHLADPMSLGTTLPFADRASFSERMLWPLESPDSGDLGSADRPQHLGPTPFPTDTVREPRQ